MRALVYNGPFDVEVTDVPDAPIEAPTDAVVRITTSNICGSDLHMYEGRTGVETARCSGTRTWASSRRSAPGSPA